MKISKNYIKVILLNTILILVARALEIFLILNHYGNQKLLIGSELLGVLYDLMFSTIFLLLIYPLFILIDKKISTRFASASFRILIIVLAFCNFILIKYFLYGLTLLGNPIYQYSLNEVFDFLQTSEVSFVNTTILLILYVGFSYAMFWFLQKLEYLKYMFWSVCIISVLSVPLFVFIHYSDAYTLNKFAENKSLFFYNRTASYLITGKIDDESYVKPVLLEYQKLNPENRYIGIEYPLCHEFNQSDELGNLIGKFNTPPNIVLIIVDGLNNNFLQPYKGIELMPFLSELKNKSLYWENCFTPGISTASALASALGSLPLGEKGFTELEIIPRHLSLIPILKSNGYYCTFFHGQGSWIDQKDRFLKYNDIDLIVDNKSFGDEYEKIVIGEENFFWGYNDKDLFRKAFTIIDTLKGKSRFDIYLTGSSQSPFVIADTAKYNMRFKEMVDVVRNRDDQAFLMSDNKSLRATMFADDALNGFFEEYSKRGDYQNTLFIITGAHPLIDLNEENPLKKYHTPLMIFSNNLKVAKRFTNTVSQQDIYETLLAYLNNCSLKVPELSASSGGRLEIAEQVGNTKRMAFLNEELSIKAFSSDDYYLSGDQLYMIGKNLSLYKTNDKKIKSKLQNELEVFKKINSYVALNDKIISDSSFCSGLGYSIISSNNVIDTLKVVSEYVDILAINDLSGTPKYFDVYFKFEGEVDEATSLVVQLSTKNENSRYWSEAKLIPNSGIFQNRFKISVNDIDDKELIFKSYIWNKSRKEFKIFNLKYLLYEK